MEIFIPVVLVLVAVAVLFYLLARFQPSVMNFLRATATAEEAAKRVVSTDTAAILTVEDEIRRRPDLNPHFDSISEQEKLNIARMSLQERVAYYDALEHSLRTPDERKKTVPEKKDSHEEISEEMFQKYALNGQLDDAIQELTLRAKRELAHDLEALERRLAMINNLATKIRMKHNL